MINLNRLILILFFGFSSSAFSAESQWQFNYSSSSINGIYGSPQAACTALKGHFNSNWIETMAPVVKGDTFHCVAKGGGQTGQYGSGFRIGPAPVCEPDFGIDPVTGECIPPPHQCEVGDVIGPYKYPGVLSGGFVITTPPPPTSACKNGCEYSRKSTSSGCQTGVFGTFCTYQFVGTGAECTPSPENDMGGDSGEGPNANDGGDGGDGAGDGSDGGNNGDGGDEDNGDAQDDMPEAPETSTAEGDAKESTLQEVKSVLGTLSKESTIKKIESGISKSNTLLQGIKDAIGNIPGGGGGNANGNGGDGDGDGDLSVGSCSDALVCSGDAIQCAMLQVQKNQLCLYQITPEIEQQINSVFEGEENQLETKEIEVGALFTDGLNAARWLPTSCPVAESVSVFGRSYSISWQPLCTFASSLSALIVAMASIFFIVYIGKGLKGS